MEISCFTIVTDRKTQINIGEISSKVPLGLHVGCATLIFFFSCFFHLTVGRNSLILHQDKYRLRIPQSATERVEILAEIKIGCFHLFWRTVCDVLGLWIIILYCFIVFSGNFILLAGALFLCVRVRNAPSAYNETRYTTWAVYNAMFITCFVAVSR